MVDRFIRRIAANQWLPAITVGGLIALGSARASAMELENKSKRAVIAVGIERPGDLSLPAEFGEFAGGYALAQGVREACLEPGAHRPRTKQVACATLRDVPDAQICVDETADRALTRDIRCSGDDVTAEALDLSRSGCSAADCFAAEAKLGRASYLLVVHAVWKDGLSLVGTVTDLATDQSRSVTTKDLEPAYNQEWPRSGPQVLGLLKWFSRRVTLDVLAERTLNGGTGAPASASTPVLAAPAQPAAAPPSSTSRKWIGWTLVGAGVAAGAAAAIVWSKDGDPTGCFQVPGDGEPCREVYRTMAPTVALGVGAAAAIVVGTVVLFRGRNSDANLALSAHPSGILVGGRF